MPDREPAHWVGTAVVGLFLILIGAIVLSGGVTTLHFIAQETDQPHRGGHPISLNDTRLNYSELSESGKEDFNRMISGEGVKNPEFHKEDMVVTQIAKNGETYFIRNRLSIGKQEYDSLRVKIGGGVSLIGVLVMMYSSHQYSLSKSRQKIEGLEDAYSK